MAKDTGGPAFPISREQEGWYEGGMSLRDYFAGQALVSVLADPSRLHAVAKKDDRDPMKFAADIAYAFADAMLKARSTDQ